MKVLSIISQKGGVGKTTLATALAVAAEKDGKQVAILDLDDQASACFWSDIREAPTPAVKDVKAVRLGVYLQSIREAGCDLVIIDCPPVHKDIALDAAAPADFVLIPSKPDLFDIRSMTMTVKLLSKIAKPSAVVLTFCPPAGPEVPGARATVQDIGAALCPIEIGLRKSYARAQQTGQTAQEFEPDGKAAEEITSLYKYTCIQLNKDESCYGQVQSVASCA
ncbi:MAG: AAA family ATPase [Caldilineaceae bacterium]